MPHCAPWPKFPASAFPPSTTATRLAADPELLLEPLLDRSRSVTSVGRGRHSHTEHTAMDGNYLDQQQPRTRPDNRRIFALVAPLFMRGGQRAGSRSMTVLLIRERGASSRSEEHTS